MKAKKILLSLLTTLCFGFSALTITSCDLFTTDSSNNVSGGNDSTPSDTPSEEQPHVHTWDDGEETTKATCTTDGQITYTCSGCDEVKFETIAATGHTEVVDAAVAATCTETGLTEGKHCSVCNEVLVHQQIVPTSSHSYEAVVTEPTCTAGGYTTYICEDCDHSYISDNVAALGHTEVVDAAVEPTCTEVGLTEGKHCSVCNETLIVQEEIEMIEHVFENGKCTECDCDYFTQDLEFSLSSDGESYSVTSIGTATDTNIIIPSVYKGKAVKAIGRRAFEDCSSLKEITIPDSVTYIGEGAFCNNITSIYYKGSIESWCNITFLSTIWVEHILYMLDENKDYYVVRDVIIPEGITTLSNYAFYGLSALKSVIIPDSVTSIGDSAFSGCSSLTKIEIPDSVTSIGSDAFGNCSSLESITIPEGVTSIGKFTFSHCSSLSCITIPNSITSIGDYAFSGCSSLESITIPESVTSIGQYSFKECKKLKSIIIPDSVTSIGWQAFCDCYSLEKVKLSENLSSVDGLAFYGCHSLTNITIPASVTLIGYSAFYNCNSLENITIEAGDVLLIGEKAFDYCSSLAAIYYTGTKEQWNNIIINKTGNDALSNATIVYNYAYTTEGLEFTLSEDGESYSVTGIGTATDTDVVIPSVHNDKPVTSIGESAFQSCGELTSITIPNSVTSINDYAFYYCTSLTSITIPDSVTSIGFGAFWCCSSLKSIVIPDSVKYIGENAFHQCDSLTTVYYTGTEEQWNAITIGSQNEVLTNEIIQYNYVTE